tara:strand:- start:128033 stop:129763 length:1731 start_codon:yes stop_codon:yes gene_type:complete
MSLYRIEHLNNPNSQPEGFSLSVQEAVLAHVIYNFKSHYVPTHANSPNRPPRINPKPSEYDQQWLFEDPKTVVLVVFKMPPNTPADALQQTKWRSHITTSTVVESIKAHVVGLANDESRGSNTTFKEAFQGLYRSLLLERPGDSPYNILNMVPHNKISNMEITGTHEVRTDVIGMILYKHLISTRNGKEIGVFDKTSFADGIFKSFSVPSIFKDMFKEVQMKPRSPVRQPDSEVMITTPVREVIDIDDLVFDDFEIQFFDGRSPPPMQLSPETDRRQIQIGAQTLSPNDPRNIAGDLKVLIGDPLFIVIKDLKYWEINNMCSAAGAYRSWCQRHKKRIWQYLLNRDYPKRKDSTKNWKNNLYVTDPKKLYMLLNRPAKTLIIPNSFKSVRRMYPNGDFTFMEHFDEEYEGAFDNYVYTIDNHFIKKLGYLERNEIVDGDIFNMQWMDVPLVVADGSLQQLKDYAEDSQGVLPSFITFPEYPLDHYKNTEHKFDPLTMSEESAKEALRTYNENTEKFTLTDLSGRISTLGIAKNYRIKEGTRITKEILSKLMVNRWGQYSEIINRGTIEEPNYAVMF